MESKIKFFAAALLLATTASALAEVHYVDVNSTNATPPYTNWSTAATQIQYAVDAAVAGDEVVVTNGIYLSGGRTRDNTFNRVAVDKPIAVRSVNGPQVTVIQGRQLSFPAGIIRCVYLTNDANLSGFTLTRGYLGPPSFRWGGAGVLCEPAALVSNCVITGNSVSGSYSVDGGGAYGGILNDCMLTGNSVSNFTSALGFTSVFGGGASHAMLNRCTLSGNSASAISTNTYFSADAGGGGVHHCRLNNCMLIGNSASVLAVGGVAFGGGADDSTLNNCTLVYNSAVGGSYSYIEGGGVWSCTLNNCITFGNPPDMDYYSPGNLTGNNWIGDPLFVGSNGGANLRLQSNSPCINAGNNSCVTNAADLDGNPRIAGGTVDIGAYEFQAPASMISYAWLQQFNLPINPATDTADPDGDAVDNYHEWLAGTDPTNRFSSPAQLTIVPAGVPPSGIILSWPTNAVGFTLQSTTNLGSSAVWSTNSPAPVVIAGQNLVTNSITGPQQFYRLRQ